MNIPANIGKPTSFAIVLIIVAIGCDTVLTFSGGGGGTTTTTDDVGLPAETTRSFFTAFQIDPVAEDTAGPKFVTSADIDKDGLLDIISGWNQSQPVQLHLQRRDAAGVITFRTITIAGTSPIAVMAGIEVGQINDDNNDGVINDDDWLDIVVLVKSDGFTAWCPPKGCVASGDCSNGVLCIDGCCGGDCRPSSTGNTQGQIVIYFNPGSTTLIPDGDSWSETILVNPLVVNDGGTQWANQYPGKETGFENSKTRPETGGFTDLVVADIDGQDGDDIIVALNPAVCDGLGQDPPLNTVDLWVNPGGVFSEDPNGWGAPVTVMGDLPDIKDIEVMDIDVDGNLDIIATYPNAISRNIRWARNPLPANDVTMPWEQRPIGQVDTGADVIAIGDLDNDGSDDIVVRSNSGTAPIVQWFRHPNVLVHSPEFPPPTSVPSRFNFPWTVYTITELFDIDAIAVGDVTGDSQVEILLSSEGGVFWLDGTVGASVFDPWQPNTIINANPLESTIETTPIAGAGVGVIVVDRTTVINTLHIADIDGDGMNDVIGTLDRQSGTGLSDDRLVWYLNTR